MLAWLKLLPSWSWPVAACAALLSAYGWGRHDGRAIEASAALRETVKAQGDQVKAAADQLGRDKAIERDRAQAMAELTDNFLRLLSQPPKTVTKYVEVPTHGAASVRCPAGVSPEFVFQWNAAADAADPAK